jgi:hypothetical protein
MSTDDADVTVSEAAGGLLAIDGGLRVCNYMAAGVG